eukprot:TRINITY_DN13216_c0_g1_i5.p1 TRINITY_DN13216_c0_g1~~TRINITY_DN13216_c0_g1_i5.p1  ORF type:complete len:404 (-),score=52.47 TRINITY_DN13216_c0_g1_i5:206-1417(-)
MEDVNTNSTIQEQLESIHSKLNGQLNDIKKETNEQKNQTSANTEGAGASGVSGVSTHLDMNVIQDLKEHAANTNLIIDQEDIFHSVDSQYELDPWNTLDNQLQSFQDGESIRSSGICSTLEVISQLVRFDKSEAVRASEKCCVLLEIVKMDSDNVLVQYAWKPQPAVGLHRVLVAKILAFILEGGRDGFDEGGGYFEGVYARVEQSRLLEMLLQLAFDRPHASTFHAMIFRCMNAVVEHGYRQEACNLLSALLKLEVAPNVQLLAAIKQIVLNNSNAPQGQRPSVVSFCINLAVVMKGISTGLLVKFQDDEWSNFVRVDGELEEILTQQNSELGGMLPRTITQIYGPQSQQVKKKEKVEVPETKTDAPQLTGGQLLSGQEIIAMIQSFCGFGQTSFVLPLQTA